MKNNEKKMIKLKMFYLLIGYYFLTAISFANSLMQLATPYSEKSLSKISDYWISEKLDGVRAYWDGKNLITRQGYRINVPKWFIQNLGEDPLDGELWIAHEQFDEVSRIIRLTDPKDADWKKVNYMIFDLPPKINFLSPEQLNSLNINPKKSYQYHFDERIILMEHRVKQINRSWVKMIPQIKLKNNHELNQYLKTIVQNQGEGLMLHKGSSIYTIGRNRHLLKYKLSQDAEGIVISYINGKGKYKGMLGALVLLLPNGKKLKLGSGFTDLQRKLPPKIGDKVTFTYNGFTKNGLPKFARFMRVRSDL